MKPPQQLGPGAEVDPLRELLPFYLAALVGWGVVLIAVWEASKPLRAELTGLNPFLFETSFLAFAALGPLAALLVWLTSARRHGSCALFEGLAVFANPRLPGLLYRAAYGPAELETAHEDERRVLLRPLAHSPWHAWFRPLIVNRAAQSLRAWRDSGSEPTLVLREERPLGFAAWALLFPPLLAWLLRGLTRSSYAAGLRVVSSSSEGALTSLVDRVTVAAALLSLALVVVWRSAGQRVVATDQLLAVGARVFGPGSRLQLAGRWLRAEGLCWSRGQWRPAKAEVRLADPAGARGALEARGWEVSGGSAPKGAALGSLGWLCCLAGLLWLSCGQVPVYLRERFRDGHGQHASVVCDGRDLSARWLVIWLDRVGEPGGAAPELPDLPAGDPASCYVVTREGVQRERLELPPGLLSRLEAWRMSSRGTLLDRLVELGVRPRAVEGFARGARTLTLSDASGWASVGIRDGRVVALVACPDRSALSPFNFSRATYLPSIYTGSGGRKRTAPLPSVAAVLEVQRAVHAGVSLRAALGKACPGLYPD